MAKSNFVNKAVKKVGRAVKRRYFKGKGYGNPKIGTMMKDIKYLKSVLNPEKKTWNLAVTDGLIGQTSNNVGMGYFSQDVTPDPAQNATSIGRNGNSIRLHSSYFKFQLQSQANFTSPMRVKLMLIKVMGPPQTTTNIVTTMFDDNPFIGGGSIVDYNSDRNQSAFKQYKVIRTIYTTLPAPAYAGQQVVKTISMGVKYKSHHIKFFADASSQIQDGQLVLLGFADNGNRGTNNSVLTGTASTIALSGANIQCDFTTWFYDN